MKTLVIHPKDTSTDFLSKIYEGKGFTVITENPSNSNLRKLIKDHDRIIMLGHGDGTCLFGHKRRIITSDHVYLLREKQCVAIWCHADLFMRKYDLKGFFTGMFISEVDEAYYEGVYNITHSEIELSNDKFATLVGQYLNSDDILNEVRDAYQDDDSAIIVYNSNRLYLI